MKPSHHENKKKVLGGLGERQEIGWLGIRREAGRCCVANKLEHSPLLSSLILLYSLSTFR